MTEDLTAALAEIRERYAARPGDVECLLEAVGAVLRDHRKMTIYALSVREFDHEDPPRVWCGHSYEETEDSRHAIADNGDTLCLDKPEGDVCETCRDESGELVDWPCPTYEAISRALSGTGAPAPR